MPVRVSFQRQTHSSCCGKRVILLFHTLFTWLHNAGAKNSFIYLTALLTPDRMKRNGGIGNEEDRHRMYSSVERTRRTVTVWSLSAALEGESMMKPYLCPCSVFCHCHGAPEPHKCLWKHRWALQL